MSRDREPSTQALERDIEETRRALGDTVEALARKADVKAQVRTQVERVKDEPAGPGRFVVPLLLVIVLLWLMRRRTRR